MNKCILLQVINKLYIERYQLKYPNLSRYFFSNSLVKDQIFANKQTHGKDMRHFVDVF